MRSGRASLASASFFVICVLSAAGCAQHDAKVEHADTPPGAESTNVDRSTLTEREYPPPTSEIEEDLVELLIFNFGLPAGEAQSLVANNAVAVTEADIVAHMNAFHAGGRELPAQLVDDIEATISAESAVGLKVPHFVDTKCMVTADLYYVPVNQSAHGVFGYGVFDPCKDPVPTGLNQPTNGETAPAASL